MISFFNLIKKLKYVLLLFSSELISIFSFFCFETDFDLFNLYIWDKINFSNFKEKK